MIIDRIVVNVPYEHSLVFQLQRGATDSPRYIVFVSGGPRNEAPADKDEEPSFPLGGAIIPQHVEVAELHVQPRGNLH